MSHTIYGPGGYNTTKPHNNVRWQADDATRTVTDYSTTPPTSRPYTAAENAAADAAIVESSTLTDLVERVRRIEAVLWPTPPTPTAPTDPAIKTWAQWGGQVPNDGLLKDGATVYRNVSGNILTTPPSGFPGTPGQWTHLWLPVTIDTPAPTYPAWSATATYAVGDKVTEAGQAYVCLVAHGAERQGTWRPSVTIGTVWRKL